MQQNILPVAERELRAAARHKSTYRLRSWTALLAIAGSFVWLISSAVPSTPAKFTSSLFTFQTACAFGFALLAGPFLTSDCISEEKRDGTLNLLFLANLKAGDIVLGKFAGMSLSAIYGLLALVPVTAIPILCGGVGLAEFWRTALALINTLFFSLALGLGVSAVLTDYSRCLATTLGLLALFGGGLPALAALAPMTSRAAAWSWLTWFSPFFPFWCARDAVYFLEPHKFWTTLFASHLMGWIGLALAGSGLRHLWKDSCTAPNYSLHRPRARRRNRPRHHRPRTTAESFDPMLRLIGNATLVRRTVWLIVVAWGALLCANRFWLRGVLPDSFLPAKICGFLLKALLAFQACRFFVETRRNGALELLLCTPLRNADLIRAQWRALLRVFLWPLAVFLVLSWTTVAFPLDRTPLGFRAAPLDGLLDFRTGFLGAFFLGFRLVADVSAAGWVGMWLALTLRNPGLAPALTILDVLILPAVLGPFDLVADMVFISWGTTRFQEEFRWVVATRLSRADAPY
jgi:ABC-type transport system involved in multi-copper enzyme maturation permease subunit